jgi:N-acetylneuraminate lyase
MTVKLHGLVAATHTPFDVDGQLNLNAVGKQAGHLLRNGAKAVFVGGITGESHSLTLAEQRSRLQSALERLGFFDWLRP